MSGRIEREMSTIWCRLLGHRFDREIGNHDDLEVCRRCNFGRRVQPETDEPYDTETGRSGGGA